MHERNNYLTHFDKTTEHLKTELASLRTNRAAPSLVENLMVDYYGTKTPLVQIASISTPEPRMLVIQPWDKNSNKAIEKAIQSSDLGLNPINEGNVVRLIIPPMTEERRNELVKLLGKKLEVAKVGLRNIREEVLKKLKFDEKEGLISEDQLFQSQKKIQKDIENYNQKISEIGLQKEKEITTI
jgi:ribosome recycling factor